VGSKAYMTHLESKVFGKGLPILICAASGNPDYEKLIKDALNSVADQLGRDLDNAIRENDYITDETADKLKVVISELDHCGVSTSGLNSKIEKLAWFVGGDPVKIKDLQSKLNELGVCRHIKEDGVYGAETAAAVARLSDEMSDILKNPNKLRLLNVIISSGAVPSDSLRKIRENIKSGWWLFWDTIWKLGAECFLRPQGYNVAALLLEHSLEGLPRNLYFHQTHWATQKIIESKGFQREFSKLKRKIQQEPELYATDGSMDTINFQETGDTDLYYGIGKCTPKYTCTRYPSSVRIDFTIDDTYNFDEIRTITKVDGQWVTNFGLGSIANDLGLLSQATKVISVYRIIVSFSQTIELN